MSILQDDRVIEAAQAALEATGAFDRVLEGSPWSAPAGDRERALAWVELDGYSTEARSVDYSTRVIRYRLWITSRSQERDHRQDGRRRLASLIEAAQQALTQTTLGLVGVQPARTRVDTGDYEVQVTGPSFTVEIAGQVSVTRPGRGRGQFGQQDPALFLPVIDAFAAANPPTVGHDSALLLPVVLATAEAYPPGLEIDSTLLLPVIDSLAAAYPPTVSHDSTLTLPVVDSLAVAYPPSLSAEPLLGLPVVDALAVAYPPGVAFEDDPGDLTGESELLGRAVGGGGVPYSIENEVIIAKGPSILPAGSTANTVAAWVEIPASIGWRSVRYTIVSVGEPGGDEAPVVLDYDHNRVVRFMVELAGGGTASVTRSSGVATDDLNLVVAVRDGNTLRLSINGSAFSTATGAGTDPIASTETWLGGLLTASWPHQSLFGGLQRVMAWDRALTEADVAGLFAAGPGATAEAPPVAGPIAWVEPYAWRFADRADPGRLFRFDHVPIDGFRRPSSGGLAGECHVNQYATSVPLGGRTWSSSYATAPVLRDPPRRLDLAGVCSMASEGAAISGRSSWDWLIQGFFPSPAATAEQWYGEVAEDGSGLRISVRPDGRVALDYFGPAGDPLESIVSDDSVYGRREILGSTGTDVTIDTRQVTRMELDVGPGHRFASDDLIRIEGDPAYPDEMPVTETDPEAGWIRFLAFGGHGLTPPAVGAEAVATGRVGAPRNTTGGTTSGLADDRVGWVPESRWLPLRVSRRGDAVTFAARGREIGATTAAGLPLGPTGEQTPGRAVGFDGAGQSLSAASNASVQAGDGDWGWSGWIRLDSKASNFGIAGKGVATGDREWQLFYSASDVLRFLVAGSGGANRGEVDAAGLGSPPLGTWLFVSAWHDAAAQTVNIRVDDNPPNAAATTGTLRTASGPFRLGAGGSIAGTMFGRMDNVAWYKAPPGGIGSRIAELHEFLYNGGAGRRYEELSGAQKADFGLVSWWDLDEEGGARQDRHGANHLAADGEPTAVDGVAGAAANPVTSYLGVDPGSDLAAPTGDLMRLATGEGWADAEIAQAEARASAIVTCRDAELDRRSLVDLAELPALDREWLAHYPVELAFRDAATGEVVGEAHPTTGQAYGRPTGFAAYVQLGGRDLAGDRSYVCEVTVFDRPYNADFSPRSPAVLFHGAVATITRGPLDGRWVTKYVDPTHPDALNSAWNDGTDPSQPLGSVTWAARSAGIYTRVVLAPVDFVAAGAINGGIGMDWPSSNPNRMVGPSRLETAAVGDFAEVGAWRVKAGNYMLAIHGLSSVTENAYDSIVMQIGTPSQSAGQNALIEVADCRIVSNRIHCRVFGSDDVSLHWGGFDRIEHRPNAASPGNSYGYFVEIPGRHAAWTRLQLAIQNDTQHPLRVMGCHGIVLGHWPPRDTTNYGSSFRTITLRQQVSHANVYDMAYQGWHLWNDSTPWSTLPADRWRVERGQFGQFQFDPASGLAFAHLHLRVNPLNFKAINSTGEQPHYVTRRRNVAVGLQHNGFLTNTDTRFDAWPTSGPSANRQAAGGDFAPASAPGVALAAGLGSGRVAFQAGGYPLGGTTGAPIRMQWQRRAEGSGDWTTIDGVGAAYGTDRPGPGTWVYRTRVVDPAGVELAVGAESDPVAVAVAEAGDGPAPMALGTGLPPLHYYSPDGALVDVAKQGTSTWELKGPESDSEDRPAKDANGYPIGMGNLDPANYYRTAPFLNAGGLYPTGTYRMRFAGTGRVQVRNRGNVVLDTTESGALHDVVVSAANNTGLELRIYESDPLDHVTAVNLYLPGQWGDGVAFADSDVPRPWSPAILARATPFDTFRMMDPLQTNSQSLVQEWDDRARLGAMQTGDRGVAPELALRLAMQAGRTPWINLGHLTTEDYAFEFGALALALGVPAIVLEYTNEPWNQTFQQHSFLVHFGTWPSQYQRHYADRAIKRFEAFIAGFGGNRAAVTRVAAWQRANPAMTRTVLGYFELHDEMIRGPAADGGYDLISVDAYWGHEFPAESTGVPDAQIEQFYRDWIPGELEENLTPAIPALRAEKEWTLGRTIRLDAYEAGPHDVPTRGGGVLDPALADLHRSEAMYEAVLGALTRMEALGWDRAVMYYLAGRISQWGAWGLLEWISQDPAEAPKYRACMDFLAGQRLVLGAAATAPARPAWLGEDFDEVPGTEAIAVAGGPGYAEAGAWTTSGVASYSGASRYADPGPPGASASFAFEGLTPGAWHLVMISWSAASNRASNAPWSVEDGTGRVLATRRIDQRFPVQRYVAGAATWHVLAAVASGDPTLVVRVTNDADGLVIADACRVVRAVRT
ncbi:LamG-like jellyroll fold domain-containing protein [Tautonia sp. JC769]|uniref:LamG-like jellyroll fold domain-containing protein n=1 Tax=Tautonia sp. JC769 TaxID=3232135 RepID=UPI003459DE3F